ncbi:MAG: glycoside hydrolase family 57 protein [Rikenellaceae bacterium]
MKNVCLYFQVHQPYRLKQYRFFNMGKDHFYFDSFLNRTVMQRVASECYLPMNDLLLKLIEKSEGKFKVTFSITGSAIEQFKEFAPEVLDSFKALALTGCVEFVAETWNHTLAALRSKVEFEKQVVKHRDEITKLFGVKPTTFRNTELVYSDEIGSMAEELGFETVLAEGAKQVLGWKSPNYIYSNPIKQNQKILLRNYKLSDDIAFRFSDQGWAEYPLTAEKYIGWLNEEGGTGDVVNLFMDYETFGEHNKAESGIFKFFEGFINAGVEDGSVNFMTPCEVAKAFQSVAILSAPHPMSWADEERDLSAWLGNELQDEAFNKIYSIRDKVAELDDEDMCRVFGALQTSDHFYYMCTKWFSDGDVHSYFNPYDSPYEAFMNYMNVFSDFAREVELKLQKK